MTFSFAKFNDPEYRAEMKKKQAEKDARQKQMEDWRKRTVGATGHRSDKMGGFHNALGGYNRNHPLVIQAKQHTLAVLEKLIIEEGMTRFVSGGALGYDTLFFWCVNHLKKKYPHIENVVAIPFLNQWIAWIDTLPIAVEWYHTMIKTADHVIDVARHSDYATNQDRGQKPIHLDYYSKEKMNKRNEFMVDQSCYLLAYYDGSPRGTGQCIRYAQRNYTNRPRIIRMDPRFGCEPKYC
ncbi:SLOG family protein [Brevibacillus sp. NPDC058079]|uniref:SLOG family protein n=1 Tax=Brevibacillus sp. NPDC058079 TaxID=3346330 RepID=UPI0036E4DCAE